MMAKLLGHCGCGATDKDFHQAVEWVAKKCGLSLPWPEPPDEQWSEPISSLTPRECEQIAKRIGGVISVVVLSDGTYMPQYKGGSATRDVTGAILPSWQQAYREALYLLADRLGLRELSSMQGHLDHRVLIP